jgi:putative flippase GtrA
MKLRNLLIKIGAVLVALALGVGLHVLLTRLGVDKEIANVISILGGIFMAFVVYTGLEEFSLENNLLV